MKEDGFCAIVAPAAARNYPRRQKVRLLTDRSLNVSSDRTQMLRHTFLLAHAHVYTHTHAETLLMCGRQSQHRIAVKTSASAEHHARRSEGTTHKKAAL